MSASSGRLEYSSVSASSVTSSSTTSGSVASLAGGPVDGERILRALQPPHQVAHPQRDERHGEAVVPGRRRLGEQPLDLVELAELVEGLGPQQDVLGGGDLAVVQPGQALDEPVVVGLAGDAGRRQQQRRDRRVPGGVDPGHGDGQLDRRDDGRPGASIRAAPSSSSRRLVSVGNPARMTSPCSGWARRTGCRRPS